MSQFDQMQRTRVLFDKFVKVWHEILSRKRMKGLTYFWCWFCRHGYSQPDNFVMPEHKTVHIVFRQVKLGRSCRNREKEDQGQIK